MAKSELLEFQKLILVIVAEYGRLAALMELRKLSLVIKEKLNTLARNAENRETRVNLKVKKYLITVAICQLEKQSND